MSRIVCYAVLFLILGIARAQGPADQPQQLEPIDMFRLDYLMVYPTEEPLDWLDGEHYLVFDAGPGAMPGRGKASWSRVVARTGQREPYVDRDQLEKALAGLVEDRAAVAAIDDADSFTWNDAHTMFVVNAGNDLYAGGLDGGLQRLTGTPEDEEVGVRISPDGSSVAFVARHNLHVVGSSGGEVRALTTEGHADLFCGRLDWVYQEELYGRGNFQGYWWSPDSKRIALLRLDESPVAEFVIVREEPARPEIERTNYPKVGEPNPIVDIGVIDVGSGETKWFDLAEYPAEDRLVVRVTWAPDSAEVLFQVQGREQIWLDMLAGDPAAGTVRKLWREDSDCWVEAGPEPVWLAGGAEFLWLSERDGFRHVYRYGRDGALRGRLTAGEWQVLETIAVDEAAGVLYATADKESPLQAQLYAIPLAGGEMKRITAARGTHGIDMAPDQATFLDRHSDATTPPSTSLCAIDGKKLRGVAKPRSQMMAPYDLVEPEFHIVPARDGYGMQAMLLKPHDFDTEKRYPVVQFTYSGPHTPRVRDQWGGRDYLWHQLLVQRGYVVFVCDNRSASGTGRRYAKACWKRPGQSELSDLEDSVDWLAADGIADPGRIAIWGWSYGGYQTLYNLTHSTKWKCGVAVNAVTDWRNYDTVYTERYFGLPETNADGYDRGSVVAAAANLHGSLLLIAATLDDNVHLQNSLQFLQALQLAGKDCELMLYPGVRHGIETLPQQLNLFGRFLRFLKERL
ncbi:MAG: DPP IV N-terminal domain-containing protein [Planctomycetes bacterium]|nr:DPP IV N-terminal domain-containing protein [Planctomycetota bacterium]